MMNTKILTLTSLACAGLGVAQTIAAEKQPNIVYILVDDHGIGDLGCFGNKFAITPNIDNFYKDAIRFTDFHVSPTSAPSRGALMTGRYSNRVGTWHTINGRSILWEDEVTIADVLSANGYSCGAFGKWHLGDNYPSRPDDKGFNEVVVHGGGGITQGPDYWGNDYFDDYYRHNGEWKQYKGYCTDVFFECAIDFIEKSVDDKKPFFCYIPTNAAHHPLNVAVKYQEMYADKVPERRVGTWGRFYGMITNVDENFAILLDKLKELGIEDDTIVMYMTDNGTSGGNSGGYRGQKGSPYDGGHRVPWIVRYPKGGLTGGKDITTLTSHIDLLPTFIDYLNLKKGLPKKALDGESLVPLFSGKDVDWDDRSVIVDSQRDLEIVKWKNSSIMNGNWRLVNGEELYNLATDKAQAKDVAAEHPDVIKKLKADYEAWWEDIAVKDDVNNRFGYIVAGGAENPVRISSHDLMTNSANVYAHRHVVGGKGATGIFKIGIEKSGKYKFSLCRYPLETGLKFNSVFEAVPSTPEVPRGMGGSRVIEYKSANLKMGSYDETLPVNMDAQSVDFVLDLKAGRYDVAPTFEAARKGGKSPAYYLYIEKLD